MTEMTKLYVIGDKQTGVLFLTLDPLRAGLVSAEDISDYAKKNHKTDDQVYGEIAAAAQKLIIQNDGTDEPPNMDVVWESIGTLVRRGTTVTDAEFCFIAEIAKVNWRTYRIPYPLLDQAIGRVSGEDG